MPLRWECREVRTKTAGEALLGLRGQPGGEPGSPGTASPAVPRPRRSLWLPVPSWPPAGAPGSTAPVQPRSGAAESRTSHSRLLQEHSGPGAPRPAEEGGGMQEQGVAPAFPSPRRAGVPDPAPAVPPQSTASGPSSPNSPALTISPYHSHCAISC